MTALPVVELTSAELFAGESRSPRATKIDVVLASFWGGEIRLVGNLLPYVAARLEHYRWCDWCDGRGSILRHCDGCDDTGYAPLEESCGCSHCRLLEHVCQPGNDMDERGMGELFLDEMGAVTGVKRGAA